MSCWASRMCSTSCQAEWTNPFGTAPRSVGGSPLTAASNPTWAFSQSMNSANCARNAFSAFVIRPTILQSCNSALRQAQGILSLSKDAILQFLEHPYHVRSGDDEGL